MKSPRILTWVGIAILLVMTAISVVASLDRNILAAGDLFADPWFVATLCDAYCGFVLFYCWVVYKERSLLTRGVWFVAIMLLGNFAMATYLLIQLSRAKEPTSPGSGARSFAERLLLRA